MKIYHVTSQDIGTKILMSGKIETNGKAYFCQTRSGAEAMLKWWNDIKFKPDQDKEILELLVNDIEYTPDPHTLRFGGCVTTKTIIIKSDDDNEN